MKSGAETEYQQAKSLILEEINRIAAENGEFFSPNILALSVLERIDPQSASPPLIRAWALLELRQVAREVCRERDVVEASQIEEQGELFERLQSFYPATRDGDHGCLRRDFLSYEDFTKNAQRLEHEGAAKMNHAKALIAERDMLVETGQLEMPEEIREALKNQKQADFDLD